MRFLTAGESHGKGLVGILEGMPSNLKLNMNQIKHELARRQTGYGRGGRMKIETDKLEIYAGVRGGKTLGSPIAFVIPNTDYKNWVEIMGAETADETKRRLTCVRPGHADLAGCIKYGQTDARNILERASARETAVRVGIGAFCKQLLAACDIFIGSCVREIAGVRDDSAVPDSVPQINRLADQNAVRCLSQTCGEAMKMRIDECKQNGDTAGGEVAVFAGGMPVGVGSHVQADRRLDFILSGHLMGIQAVKSVSIGEGERASVLFGSEFHDVLSVNSQQKIVRKTNRAGGIEGGISNGETIEIHLKFKPIPTLMRGLPTVDIDTGKVAVSQPERSDYCAVAAAGVVAEAVTAFALCDALLAVTGGDTVDEVVSRVRYMREKTVPKREI